jgi:homoserine O-acetyltransferase
MPLACLPVEIAGRNRMQRRMIMDSIRSDPGWKNGEYTIQPRGLMAAVYIEIIATSSSLQMQKNAPTRTEADTLFDDLVKSRLARTDANDLLYQYDASREYNPAPGLGKIAAPLFAINSVDDEINPPELGVMKREIKRVKRGRFVLLPISEETRGHGTHSYPAIWQNHLAELLKESEQ